MSDEKPFSIEEHERSGGVTVPEMCKWHQYDLIVA
jgi:hypothetical protein